MHVLEAPAAPDTAAPAAIREDDPPLRVNWSEELTAETQEKFRLLIRTLALDAPRDIHLDLSACPFLDEHGTMALLAVKEQCRQLGIHLRVIPGSGRPALKLDQYGMTDLLA